MGTKAQKERRSYKWRRSVRKAAKRPFTFPAQKGERLAAVLH